MDLGLNSTSGRQLLLRQGLLIQRQVLLRLGSDLAVLLFLGQGSPSRFFLFLVFSLLWLLVWLNYFDVLATAFELVLFEPPVLWSWRSVVGPRHLAEKWRFCSTFTVTEPHMTPSFFDFVMKGVVDRELETRLRVDLVHFFDEIWTVTIPPYIPLFSSFG